jgi:S-adenosylmethionine hydrolase
MIVGQVPARCTDTSAASATGRAYACDATAMAGAVTFLTDYGLGDAFVGQCHAVLARLAPGVRVVDLTHGVPRQDVLAGAALLVDSVPYLPPGVTLAVVDPGVGTARLPVAVAAGGHWFVGPNNGLLAGARPWAASAGASSASPGARGAWAAPAVSATFHGRDLFAPAAARLALGADPAALGSALDPAALTPLALPEPEVARGRLTARVLLIDGFGNVALAAGGADLEAAGFTLGDRLRVGAHEAPLVRAFADVAEGEPAVLVDGSDRVALVVNRGRAADLLGARPGTVLTLAHAGGWPRHA